MDTVIAMGHFCDTHGPCVVLCTSKVEAVPERLSGSHFPVCDACRSVDPDTVYNCQDGASHYISARNASNPQLGQTLRDAVLRSLSVEVVQEEGEESGTIYFGDDQRGHVVSHVFDIKDSLARGFKRKYCIVVLGKHQIPMLNHFDYISKVLKQISSELQAKADKVNATEQNEKSQRDVRQSHGPNYRLTHRSLPRLVGEPEVFVQIHLWFVFLLRSEIYKCVPLDVPECPVLCQYIKEFRDLYKRMPSEVFQVVLYCVLIGVKVEDSGTGILKYFKQCLPKDFSSSTSSDICIVRLHDDKWEVNFKGTLPRRLPRLQVNIESSLGNKNLPDLALSYYLMSLIMRWFNIACILGWTRGPRDDMIRTLGVHKCDMPLLSYWIPQSDARVKTCGMDWFDKYVKDAAMDM